MAKKAKTKRTPTRTANRTPNRTPNRTEPRTEPRTAGGAANGGTDRPPPAVVPCPIPLCGAPNDPEAQTCGGCETPLFGYARLRLYPDYLFNQGLAAARDNRLAAARDCFAAVVHWCPADTEARNALALASLQLGDRDGARRHWREVLRRRSDDRKASRGLSLLDRDPG